MPWPWVQILAVLLGRSLNLSVFGVKGVMTIAPAGWPQGSNGDEVASASASLAGTLRKSRASGAPRLVPAE